MKLLGTKYSDTEEFLGSIFSRIPPGTVIPEILDTSYLQ